jgi:hypothetical protein
MRGVLAECRVVVAQGATALRRLIATMLAEADESVSHLLRKTLSEMSGRLRVFEVKTARVKHSRGASEELPDPGEFDQQHALWRRDVLSRASDQHLNMTHGVAAKLINVYLKAVFVCGGHDDHPKVKAIHPPIDRLLLESLARCPKTRDITEWKSFHPWTRLDSNRYEALINLVRRALPNGEPLGKIEEYWQGYQSHLNRRDQL